MRQPEFREMTRREVEDYLIERSLIDPEFRERLIKNPRETLSGLGLSVSAEVKIQVLVEEPGSFSIVLPRVLRESHELPAEALGDISGGGSFPLADLFKGYL
jgi:hypothetical protein